MVVVKVRVVVVVVKVRVMVVRVIVVQGTKSDERDGRQQ